MRIFAIYANFYFTHNNKYHKDFFTQTLDFYDSYKYQ